jgi:putative ATP-dependent endonuclease of OLD family
MRIIRINIENFRSIKCGEIFLPAHGVFVGDNNIGKSTLLEAIDLCMGPERMHRYPIIDEHDFYAGSYLDSDSKPISIKIEVTVIELNEEQETYFKDHLEWWDHSANKLIDSPPVESIESDSVCSAIRFIFIGKYDEEDDDFVGDTYFATPENEDETKIKFRRKDKRQCGFLFLRTLRTGSRALSLERGSLLDIILNLSEIKLKMWEETLNKLRTISVADNPELGVSGILEGIQKELRNMVPAEWGTAPQMRVSELTREDLRKTLNVFMSTGTNFSNGTEHIAPFKKQGAGTINTLVLSMLSMIADLKKNVIFAMEEPEIAIPPHTQKRIIDRIRKKSSQALFTSHSPYVLEEFEPKEIMVLSRKDGVIRSAFASFPSSIKRKAFRSEFRKRFCEALLANRVMITEGRTEYDSILAASRRLNSLDPEKYSTLETLGIATIDAGSDSQIKPIAETLRKLGKVTYAIFDKQEDDQRKEIESHVDLPFESPEKSFENLIVNHVPASRLKSFALDLVKSKDWPTHLSEIEPKDNMDENGFKESLLRYFQWSKGAGTAATLLEGCTEAEIPGFLKETLLSLKKNIEATTKQLPSEEKDKSDSEKQE